MQTIGERLEEARKKKGISIREAAEATKIRGDYLQKFESNHFDIGLTEIYTRGFLRTYSNFLKLPADRILNDYAALGRGDVRPRQPSREVYGRMDITVASTGEASERAESSDESSSGQHASSSSRAASGRSRAATSLPSGPDPAVVFRYIKWGAIAFGALLVVLIILKLLPDKPTEPARPTQNVPGGATTTTGPATTQTAADRIITLVALDVVHVRVNRRSGDTELDEIFNGTLRRGQRQPIPVTSPLFIAFSSGENLEIEFQGARYNRTNTQGMTGSNRLKME